MERKVAMSANGLPIKKGDKIKLIGIEPEDPVVGYVPEMTRLLLHHKDEQYSIHDTCHIKGNQWAISAAGWNWDTRNIYKIGDESTLPPDPEPVLFNIKSLDI